MIIGEVTAIVMSEKEMAEKLRVRLADIPGKLIAVQSHCLELEEENRNSVRRWRRK